jgi:hypothetical protein
MWNFLMLSLVVRKETAGFLKGYVLISDINTGIFLLEILRG